MLNLTYEEDIKIKYKHSMPAKHTVHMLNFAHEEDIKIKYKQVAGISRTYYQSKETISRPPQSRETIPLTLYLQGKLQSVLPASVTGKKEE
jgi:hypothetical protein